MERDTYYLKAACTPGVRIAWQSPAEQAKQPAPAHIAKRDAQLAAPSERTSPRTVGEAVPTRAAAGEHAPIGPCHRLARTHMRPQRSERTVLATTEGWGALTPRGAVPPGRGFGVRRVQNIAGCLAATLNRGLATADLEVEADRAVPPARNSVRRQRVYDTLGSRALATL